MGSLTRQQILTEAAGLAQRPVADVWAANVSGSLGNGWLQRWLDAVAASWPYVQLVKEQVVTLSTPQLTLGGVGNAITERINKVLDNLWLMTTQSQLMNRIAIRPTLGQPLDLGPVAGTATSPPKGAPLQCRVVSVGNGVWKLSFYPNPDKPYSLWVNYWAIPDALALDSSIPWYPSDETIVQAMAFKTHEWFDGKDHSLTVAAQQLLSQLLANDRIRYGMVNGINDLVQLDPRFFTRAGRFG